MTPETVGTASLRAARRFAREVRSPDLHRWYGGADPRTWSALARIESRERASPADLLRAREIVARGTAGGRFLSTLPRSGTNWLTAMIDSSINLSNGLEGDYDLVDDYFISGDPGWHPRGQRHVWQNSLHGVVHAARGTRRVEDPVILGGHFPITRGTTDLGDSGRPVVLVRDPLPAVESLVHKAGRNRSGTIRAHALSLAAGYVRFYEYWVATVARRGDAVLVLRFEDLVDDTSGGLRRLSDHWDLDLSDDAIDRAVDLCRRDRMADKARDDPSNVRVTIDAPAPDPSLAMELRELLRSRLDEPFGYDLGVS